MQSAASDYSVIIRHTAEGRLARYGSTGFKRIPLRSDFESQAGARRNRPELFYKAPSQSGPSDSKSTGSADEAGKAYETCISQIGAALTGGAIDLTPEAVTMMKKGRVELYCNPQSSVDMLAQADPSIIAQITSLVIGKDNVWGPGQQYALQANWVPQSASGISFPNKLEELCPGLKEVAVWMTHFEVQSYATRAPEALCDMLEDGTIDVLRFLLEGSDEDAIFGEDIEEHAFLSNLLAKEQIDLQKFEREHKDDPQFLRKFGDLDARIRAQGPRFASSIEYPAAWGPHVRSNRQFPDFMVVTFRRVGADGRYAFPTGDFDPTVEW